MIHGNRRKKKIEKKRRKEYNKVDVESSRIHLYITASRDTYTYIKSFVKALGKKMAPFVIRVARVPRTLRSSSSSSSFSVSFSLALALVVLSPL